MGDDNNSTYISKRYPESVNDMNSYEKIVRTYLVPLLNMNSHNISESIRARLSESCVYRLDPNIALDGYSSSNCSFPVGLNLYKVSFRCFDLCQSRQPYISIVPINDNNNSIQLCILVENNNWCDIELSLPMTSDSIRYIKHENGENITDNHEHMLTEMAFLYDKCPESITIDLMTDVLNKLIKIRKQHIYTVITFIRSLYYLRDTILSMLADKIVKTRVIKDILYRRRDEILPFSNSIVLLEKYITSHGSFCIVQSPFSIIRYPPDNIDTDTHFVRMLPVNYIVEPYILVIKGKSSNILSIVSRQMNTGERNDLRHTQEHELKSGTNQQSTSPRFCTGNNIIDRSDDTVKHNSSDRESLPIGSLNSGSVCIQHHGIRPNLITSTNIICKLLIFTTIDDANAFVSDLSILSSYLCTGQV